MKIIIPMTGTGQRFKDAGYQDLKPLIEVNGKKIIEHVVALFPGEKDFVFICREDHLRGTNMREILMKTCPTARIMETIGHKFGPVYTVSKFFDFINDDESVVINYCDFFMDWDYDHFKKIVLENDCDACLPAYQGFHPHLLPEKNFYASMKANPDGYMEEIREKYSFTPNKMDSLQQPGTFYFKNGSLVKKYFEQMMKEKNELNGEYYISLVYNLLVRDNLKVFIYDRVPYFCQWGTPEDLEEYNAWSNFFGKYCDLKDVNALWKEAKMNKKLRGRDNYNDETLKRIFDYWKAFFTKVDFHPFN
ncbi:MAG: capsular biosynthesis protein [bacterium]|nr:capsular biosynthesis protein [bacterium]